MSQKKNECETRVIELDQCVDIGGLLEEKPNVFIGRASTKRGNASAHHNLLFDDRSISGVHIAIYKCRDMEDRLMLFNALKHGFIHYKFQEDEYRVIKSNKLITLQSFDMIGISIVSDFWDKSEDDELLQYSDFHEYSLKSRLWVRILSDYDDKLLIKVIKGDELDPDLSKSEIGGQFSANCEFEIDDIVDKVINSNVYTDLNLSPSLNEEETNLLIQLCKEQGKITKNSCDIEENDFSRDEFKLFDVNEELFTEESDEDEITVSDDYNEGTPLKSDDCYKRSIYDIDELEYELLESDLKRRCLTREVSNLKHQLNEYEHINEQQSNKNANIRPAELDKQSNNNSCCTIGSEPQDKAQLKPLEKRHYKDILTGFICGSISSTVALYSIGKLTKF